MSKVGSASHGIQAQYAPEWFYRKPLFWTALTAVLAVNAAYALRIPYLAWVAGMGVGVLLIVFYRRDLGAVVTVAALCGAATAWEAFPPASSHPRDGAAVTLRGEVIRSLGPHRFVFRARSRLSLGGWKTTAQRFGVTGDDPVEAGEQLELSGHLESPLPPTNPGGFDARLSWLRRGVRQVLRLRHEGFHRLHAAHPPFWQSLASTLRARLLAANDRTLSREGALVANSFLLGIPDDADPQLVGPLTESFRDSGTIHLLVVSGTQVTLVLGVFLWLGWRFWRLRLWFWSLGMAAVGIFYLMTSGDASIARAAVMGGTFLVALALNREADGENCLGLSALVLLLFNRFVVFDIGAQLSFAALWALLRVSPPLIRALGPKEDGPPTLRSGLHATLVTFAVVAVVAHTATAPILAFHFQRESWTGILANIPMSWLAVLFTNLDFVHTVLASIGVDFLAVPTDIMARAFAGWAHFFAAPPFGAQDVFPFPVWLFPLHYALLGAAGAGSLPGWRAVMLAGSTAVSIFISERVPAPPPGTPTMRAIDIGQGDAILLQGRGGSNILMDAGPEEPGRHVPELVRALRGMRIASLDAVLVSHADSDHTGGLPALLERFPVRLLVHRIDPEPNEAPLWNRILGIASVHGVRTYTPDAGDRLNIRGADLQFLGPLEATQGNEASLIVRWSEGGARVLLTGDSGFEAEHQLLRWGPELQADVLKVGHHGSAGSSSPEFLTAVNAPIAVISCGRNNRFGHPAPAAVQRLETGGARIVRTDLGGMATVRIGSRIEVESFLK
jgi:competence protein ComEC